jgi:hypothetical protein
MAEKHKEEEIMFRKTSPRLYFALWFLLIGGFGLALAPAAHAIQTGGSISLIPDDYFDLAVVDPGPPAHDGADVFIKVRVNNTSSDTPAFQKTPPPPVQLEDTDPLPATLTKKISVILACKDNACTMPLGGSLQFLGCDMAVAGVTCTAVGNNEVDINVPAGGVPIPAGPPVGTGFLDLVRLHVKVLVTKDQVENQGLIQTFMHAMSDELGISATSSKTKTTVACDLDGCTVLTYTAGPGGVCQKRLHQPAAQILFTAGTDIIQVAVGFVSPQFPVANGDPLTLEIIKVAGPVSLFKATTVAPNLQQSGGSFVFNNPGAPPPGITHVDIDPAGGTVQILNLRAVGDLSALLPTTPTPVPVIFRVTIGATTIDVAGDLVQNPKQPDTTLQLVLPVCPKHS